MPYTIDETIKLIATNSWENHSLLGNSEEELPEKPVGRLSTVCWPTVGRLSANRRPTVDRQVLP